MDQKTQAGAEKKGSAMKILSQTSLYAPLSAYESGTLLQPKKNKVAKAHSESAFVAWVQEMSVAYHRSNDPKEVCNTGNRSMSTQEIQDKVLHRGLSLSKQYMMKPKPTTLTSSQQQQHTKTGIKRKQRKRKRYSAKNGILVGMPKADEDNDALKSFDNQSEFLQRLNELWTQYMHKLLMSQQRAKQPSLAGEGGGGDDDDDDNNANSGMRTRLGSSDNNCRNMETTKRLLYKIVERVDWVGARVCIKECKAFANWQNRQGIIVSTSTKTWTIVQQQGTTQGHGNQPCFFQMKIPKRGTKLEGLLNLNYGLCGKQGEGDGTENAGKKDSILRIRLNGDALV